jgi:hypothetical protein
VIDGFPTNRFERLCLSVRAFHRVSGIVSEERTQIGKARQVVCLFL